MSGHLPCTATLSMCRHISTLNYLRSVDTCLMRTRTVIYWLYVPAITDRANKFRVFGGHFNPKSLGCIRSCDLPTNSSLKLPCYHLVTAIFHIESKCLRDEPRGCGKSAPAVTFVLVHHTSSVFNPRCRRRERFLVLTSEWRC